VNHKLSAMPCAALFVSKILNIPLISIEPIGIYSGCIILNKHTSSLNEPLSKSNVTYKFPLLSISY
jgi:hypothetical protein